MQQSTEPYTILSFSKSYWNHPHKIYLKSKQMKLILIGYEKTLHCMQSLQPVIMSSYDQQPQIQVIAIPPIEQLKSL